MPPTSDSHGFIKPRKISLSGLTCGIALLVGVSPGLARAATIADSRAEFSGVQGANGWWHGYRNVSLDGHGTDYDPATDFVPFVGGAGQGAWDGRSQQWTGSAWDLEIAAAAPWTLVEREGLRPNGVNNGEEHWAIRRWAASELAAETWLSVQWNVRKQNLSGTGVTGGLHLNGLRVQDAAVAGIDDVGVTRTYWVLAQATDLFDLILSPLGPTGDPADGADSSYGWMVITSETDGDGDGLPDAWEEIYSPGDLTRFSGHGDFDTDGLEELAELQRGSDPTKVDTDGDGLTDLVETNTRIYVNPTDTGTNPLTADTDGDTYSDSSEVGSGHDPGDVNHSPDTTLLADSFRDFTTTGTQGELNWYHGYRNFSGDGGDQNYDPVTKFIAFDPGRDWNGTMWDLNAGDYPPRTALGREYAHPSGPQPEHWATRRWVGTQLTRLTPLALRWHLRKADTRGGTGVTGALYINGTRVDVATIAGIDGVGVTRTFYAHVAGGDIIDLVLMPLGGDYSDDDGFDGSANRLQIDSTLPPRPVQPDGTVFIPNGGPDTDSDGMGDPWEMDFFPGDLTKLSRKGDLDGDGLNDPDEFVRDTDPTKPDTDGDGLGDPAETGTGKFVSAADTGSSPRLTDTDADGLSDQVEVTRIPPTDPNKADTDGDGFSDPNEIAWGTDPVDPANNPLIRFYAHSEWEFSGHRGLGGWFNGYRIYKHGVDPVDYDPISQVIMYSDPMWTGSSWDANTAPVAPWTMSGPLEAHPNGTNNTSGGEGYDQEQWVIRRWVASEIIQTTPAALIWQVRKTDRDPSDGVTGSLYVNGHRLDHLTIAGTNGVGQVRQYYVNLEPNDHVDLALTPEGITGDRSDRGDASITWLWVDRHIPGEPRQPDGTLFIPANAEDSDGDRLLDFWELIYAADLAVLTGAGDDDSDGLNNTDEFARDSDPLRADTDGDGLGDPAESNTGKFVSPTDTGTNPRKTDTDADARTDLQEVTGTPTTDPTKPDTDGDGRTDGEELVGTPTTDPTKPDTDGDGYNDGAEVASGHNPNDASHNPETTPLARSWLEFSSEQGRHNWYYGYRNYAVDGGGINYDAGTKFIPFEPAEWTGTEWDLDVSGAAPRTMMGSEITHPNGANGGGVHWSIRRWVAAELATVTPLALEWSLRKEGDCGNGVTGRIFINGRMIDSARLAGGDTNGTTRTVYINAQPGDRVDLALAPTGPDQGSSGGAENDECDATFTRLLVDTAIPPDPRQPDGTPFIPNRDPITLTVTYHASQSQVVLNWDVSPGSTDTLWGSTDFKGWVLVRSGIEGGSHTIQIGATPRHRFYRVSRPRNLGVQPN